MSTTLTPIITTAGINAVFNADNDGLKATIKEIALGDTGWTPDNTATKLQSEKRRIPILGGERINSQQIHLTAVEDGTDLEYWVREVGFYLEDGTLIAIWSKANQSLAYKSASIDLLLAFDLLLSALPADSVTIDGSAGFSMPPASNAQRGTIRIATQAEIESGTAEDLAVNPQQLEGKFLLASPPGAVMTFAMMNPPEGWLECDGASLSRTTYAHLFAAIGTYFGAGDGSTTFDLPDLRGEFVRGWDHGREVDPSRSLGSFEDYDWKGFSMTTTGSNTLSYSHGPVYMGKSITEYVGNFFTGYWSAPGAAVGTKWDGSEIRPRNIALMYCIKY